MTTYAEAYDLVAGVVRDAWTTTGTVTEALPLHWDGVRGETPGESPVGSGDSGAFGRVTLRTTSRGLEAQGGERIRRFGTVASLAVQVFAPWGDGGALARQMAEVVLAALEGYVGSSSGVWFDGAVPLELGRIGDHYQINVAAEVRYQTRRAI